MDRAGWTTLGLTLAGVATFHVIAVALFVRRGLRDVSRRVVRRLSLAYVAVTAGGFATGLLASGGPGGRRLAGGVIGISLTWLGCWFVALALLVSRAVWRTAHLSRDAVPITPPRPGPAP